jgi:hypothetical protein
MRIFVDAPEGLGVVLAVDTAEPGAGRVDENQVADIKQAVLVFD